MNNTRGQSQNNASQSQSRWRRPIIILILILALIGINLIYEPLISQQQVTLSGNAGDLLYVSAFDGFADEWEQYTGRLEAQITDGVLRITNGSESRATWSMSRPGFDDIDLQVNATAVDGPENNGYGIVVHFKRTETTCAYAYPLVCALSKTSLWANAIFAQILNPIPLQATINYYMFLISSDGYYSLWRAENGEPVIISTWIESEAVNRGINVENHLRVIASGNKYQFFVNGTQVQFCIPDNTGATSTYFNGECLDGQMYDTLIDDAAMSGQIGLVVQTTAFNPDVVVEFDNLIVYSPQPIAENIEQ